MAIERDIHDLLHHHDCVIVPRFGGFLAHYRPARLDEAHRLVHPPARELSFNRHLVRNDGLLADQLARRTGAGFDAASGRIGEEVDGWRERIARDRRLELPRIGTFFTDAEGNLQFDPDRRVNYLRDAYGLRPVAAVPVPRKQAAPASAVVRPMTRTEVVPEDGRHPMIWAAAAVAGLVFLLGAGYLVRHTWDAPQLSAVLPWGGEPARYVKRAIERPMDTEVDTAFHVPVPDGVGVVPLPLLGEGHGLVPVRLGEAPVAAIDSTHVAVPLVPEARYHVIGGCFSIEDNAGRFIADMAQRGFQARVIDVHGGLYRVAVASYTDRAAAVEAVAELKQGVVEGAWLLVH
ncbi:MAG: SPOR domain-containing protein [Flavobacteriales bacterium]|nr:SPOR domain-containing protein [Flavobacteriales bacterium]